jgi:long-subunit fatty acid transport protein
MLARVKYTMRLGTALSLLSLVALGSSGSAHAGGFGIPEMGVRRTGMAAIVGRPDEPAAVFQNPAGLTTMHGLRVYAGFGLAFVSTEFRLRPWQDSDRFIEDPVDGDGYYPAQKPTRALGAIPMLVVSSPLWRDKLYGAVSLYVSNATGAQFKESAPTHYHLIDGYIVAPQLSISLAYVVKPNLSVGGSIGVVNPRLHGKRYVFPIVNGMDVSNLVGSKPELTLDGSDWQPTWNLGVYAAPVDGLTLGATIVGKVNAQLQGPITVVYSEDAAQPDTLSGRHSTELMLPWSFLGGAHYDVTPNLEVGAELRYWLYRQYDRQYTAVENIFLVSELETIKDYNDSWQVSGGVRVHDLPQAPRLEAMLGTHYDRTPAPARTVTLDQPTFSHIGLHSGVRWTQGRYRLAATYIHYWYDIPQIEDSITSPPSNIRGHGSNDVFSLFVEAAL